MDLLTIPTHVAGWSAEARKQGASVGFVPTMGALHSGHLDLVKRAKATCDLVICSIFVNPLQFNDPKDLAHYPRQLDQDRKLLEDAGCNAVFAPESELLFADHRTVEHDLGGLDLHWEGPSRPAHFQGVVSVVERLFFYVRPDMAFFGEKDRQQLAIIQHVARTKRWPERIVPCATVRAPDGLALSSRNARLDATEREQAVALHRSLNTMAEMAGSNSLVKVEQAGRELLMGSPGVFLEYLGIADTANLIPLTEWGDRTEAVALVAARVGPVRLIDNITITRK